MTRLPAQPFVGKGYPAGYHLNADERLHHGDLRGVTYPDPCMCGAFARFAIPYDTSRRTAQLDSAHLGNPRKYLLPHLEPLLNVLGSPVWWNAWRIVRVKNHPPRRVNTSLETC